MLSQQAAFMTEGSMTAWRRDLQARAALGTARAARALAGSSQRERCDRPAHSCCHRPEPGSLGDEAMMGVCFEELSAPRSTYRGHRRLCRRPTAGRSEPPHVGARRSFWILWGRKHICAAFPAVASRSSARYDQFWCLGADVLDGHYSPVASFRRVNSARGLLPSSGSTCQCLDFRSTPTHHRSSLGALRDLPAHRCDSARAIQFLMRV